MLLDFMVDTREVMSFISLRMSKIRWKGSENWTPYKTSNSMWMVVENINHKQKCLSCKLYHVNLSLISFRCSNNLTIHDSNTWYEVILCLTRHEGTRQGKNKNSRHIQINTRKLSLSCKWIFKKKKATLCFLNIYNHRNNQQICYQEIRTRILYLYLVQ